MPRRKQKDNKSGVTIGEEVRIAVNLALQRFLKTDEQKEYEFPSSLTSEERAYIHQLAKELGLRSKSRGKGGLRYLTVYKREGSSIVQADAVFQLVRSSRQHVCVLLHKFPLTNKERQELLPLTERDRMVNSEVKDMNKNMGRLNNGIPQVPYQSVNQELLPFRQTLPVWSMRNEIIQVINSHQVVVICGETGSGKTTQVPQFVIEHCMSIGKACRIICTQPRRLSAVSVGERVATERDEKVGVSVGYQIRLESRVSPKTVLTYCTDGVLLRTLMGGDSTLATVTHIFVDEVHERSRFSDFLLITLRDALAKFRSLRLVLMSATVDTQVFTKYFNNCPVITVPGRSFEVKEYFLEHILKCTKYMSDKMKKMKAEMKSKKEKRQKLEMWTKSIQQNGVEEKNNRIERRTIPAPILGQQSEPLPEKTELEAWLVEEMDRCLSEAWLSGSEDAFTQLLHLILSENVSVDYQHSETSVTPLMVAAGRGCLNTAEQLLGLGANINIRASNEWTALDWARQMQHPDVVELLEAYRCTENVSSELLPVSPGVEMDEEERELLDLYQHCFNDDTIDMDLLMVLLVNIHTSPEKGAILVFLPGYDDIVTLRERILAEDKRLNDACKYSLYVLHSNMQTGDQKRVFRPAPPGVRKIILSTNIAETSITIDDVVFVIDTGKVKEKSFDAISGVCMLYPVWISQACAKQRKGRAGRTQPGVCYHLFSSIRYNALQKYHTPEILRLPLQELCLHTKLLAPANTPIADFLSRAIEPPSFVVTRNAVQLLKTIDALDSWEDLTELGHHLLDLPIEPRLGKMLLYSVILKCLDPVLTIVCSLAYREPFILPNQPSQKRAAALIRKKFAAGTYSDHMALLRAFQSWQHARTNGWERSFCEKHFVSSANMEMIVGMRTQLLGQLRASGFVRARGGGDIRDLNSNSENWAVIKAALCAGMYPNLIRVDREHMQLRTQKEFRVLFHPSSTLRECPKSPRTSVAASHTATVEALPSDWLLYEEMSRSGRFCHVRCCTLVTPITVALFAGPARMPLDAVSEAEVYRGEGILETESDSEVEERPDGQTTTLKLDEWVVFRVDAEAAHLALQLRQKWHSLFLRRMRAPAKPWSQVDEAVVKTVVSVLTAEEQSLGLQQPSGIGQRPRPVTVDYYPAGSRRSPDAMEGRDETVLVASSDNRFRPQRKLEFSSKMPDLGERSESGSIKSGGSGNVSEAPSPTPSQSSTGENTVSNSTSQGSAPDTRYFIIKAGSMKSIEASLSRGVWAFTPSTERKVTRVFKEAKRVMLVFSVQGSGHFQGYARLNSDKPEVKADGSENCADLGGPNLSAPLPIEWLKRANIPFQATRHLLNPLNENRRVQTSRDGQEIEPSVGEELCELWDRVAPFVPKSALFNSLKGSPDQPELQTPKSFHGRPIRGYSFMAYGQSYQHYSPRAQNPKCRMSACGMEFHVCCTRLVSTGMFNAGCRGRWSCRPMMPHTCSTGHRSGDRAGQGNMSTLCRARWVTTAAWWNALSC
ncbi:3'-5' RNA helicase YTHDC2 [Anabrus simplex]|uniref:3'-5' RNA helicase YTHDC2 n=1 Tax=Anabrus simplex TaxID=316456 RepID=UPI0035A2CC1B